MKHHNSFVRLLRLYPVWIVLLAALFIIHSCKKDNKTPPLADPVLNQAKEWYESTYPVAGNSRMLITQNTRPASSGVFNYSQYVKPDWNYAGKYARLGKSVIEMPIDPSVMLGSSLMIQNTGKILNPSANSINSFILLN